MNPFLKKLHQISSDFEQVFFLNEYRSLAGANLRTIFALVTIMFFTFLALGFAVGGMENLEKKMSNPFTNWVNIDVNSAINKQSADIQYAYDNQQVKDSLGLKNMNGFTRFVFDFYDKEYDPFLHIQDTLHRNIWGRSIEPDEALLDNVLIPENLIWKSKTEMEACDIIVTTSLLTSTKFGIPGQNDSVLYLPIKHDIMNEVTKESESYLAYIRVHAVVNEIPGLGNRFVCFPKLHNIIYAKIIEEKKCQTIERNAKDANNYFLLTDNRENLPKVEALLQEKFKSSPFVDIENTYKVQKGDLYGLRLSFESTDAPSLDSIRKFVKDVNKETHLCEYSFIDCGGDQCDYLEPSEYNYLAFHFDKLEHIRKFKRDIFDKFNIEMDMSQVESKENFWLVSRLTLFISIILLSFGILSIVLYVNSILKNHLFNIRSNLGTFQAFGLKDSFLKKTYLKIILSFMAISILVAFILTVIVDRVEQLIKADESMFNIFSPWILIAIFSLVLINLLLATRTIRKILSDTPGNLIYGR